MSAIDEAHPEYRCQRCGGRNVTWFVDSDRFNMAANNGEIICPACFVLAHEAATGMTCSWELRPASPFRWIEDAGRPTPFLRHAPSHHVLHSGMSVGTSEDGTEVHCQCGWTTRLPERDERAGRAAWEAHKATPKEAG